jgi:CubicO group peptidase (beta-lactamase class C family)
MVDSSHGWYGCHDDRRREMARAWLSPFRVMSALGERFLGTAKPVPIDGFVQPDFLPVADALRKQLASHPGGAAVCVYHRGQCVVDMWGGFRNEAGALWQRDTMSPSFSTTKGVASTVVHVMVDRGLLDYDACVADYWPEFAQAGKASITVRQVLAHQSGLYHIRQMIDGADRMLDWEYMVRAIERATPVHEPGTRTGYHGLTYGYLVGELVQRVTGRPFAQVVREAVAEPLGLDGLYIGAPADQLWRAAQLIWPKRGILAFNDGLHGQVAGREVTEWLAGPAALLRRMLGVVGVELDLPSILDALAPRGIGRFEFGAEETLQATIPAANGLFTARSLARLYAALANDGELDGVRILSARTVARATEVQPTPAGRAVIPFDMRWRLGYHGVLTTVGVPRYAFGHFGFGGSGAFADPTRGLAVALIVNSGMGTPFGDLRIARVGGAALSSANARRDRDRRLGIQTPIIAAASASTAATRSWRSGRASQSPLNPQYIRPS